MAKRLLDIILSGLGLVVLSPLVALIALLVRIKDGSPVIYKATRIGLHGRPFQLFKFRTMIPSREKTDGIGHSVTVWADPRVTPLGRRLRRSKLDELPQLFNVLRGDMSLVGPRPEDPEYVALYTEEQRPVLSVKPGLTGVAALQYSDEETLLQGDDWEKTYRETLMPAKVALEIEYAARRSLWSDLGLLFKTAFKVSGQARRTG